VEMPKSVLMPLISIIILFILCIPRVEAQDIGEVVDKSVIEKWQTISLIEPGRIDAIASLDDGVLLAGSRNPTPGRIFRSADYGNTWTNLGQITPTGITCLLAGRGKNAYFLTEKSELWLSPDRGQTWKYQTTLSSGKNTEGFALAYGLWMTEQGTLLASDANSSGGHVYRSTDRGRTWKDMGKISNRALYRFNRAGKAVVVNGCRTLAWLKTLFLFL